MSYLLDTNICSAHMRRPGGLAHRFLQHTGRLWMPTIVLAELYAGAYLLDQPDRLLRGVSELRRDVELLGFDESCSEEFGKRRGRLKRLGLTRNPVDLMIATVALVHDLTLVTHNIRHFEGIPGLRLEDWLAP